MKQMRVSIVLCSALALVACKKGDEAAVASKGAEAKVPGAPAAPTVPAPASATLTVEAAGEKMIGMATNLAAAVQGAGGDCAKLGAAIAPLTKEWAAFKIEAKALDAVPENKKIYDEKFGKQFETVLTPAMEGMMKCKDAPEVKAFVAAL